jgi:hypothetical protein
MNKTIFNTALLALVLSMTAMDSPGNIQYFVAFISSGIVLLYSVANGWT